MSLFLKECTHIPVQVAWDQLTSLERRGVLDAVISPADLGVLTRRTYGDLCGCVFSELPCPVMWRLWESYHPSFPEKWITLPDT